MFKDKKTAIRTNIALMHHKLKEYSECIKVCTTVLKDDPNNIKAHRRRGLSIYEGKLFGDLDLAKTDFEVALAREEKNEQKKKLKAYLVQIKKLIKKQEQKQREKYRGMFDSKPKSKNKENKNKENKNKENKNKENKNKEN